MREYEAIVERIGRDRPARVLDWGCGFGQVSDLLWRAGLEVTPFDYQPDTDEVLRPLERYPHLQVRLTSDPVRLPFEDASFGAVLSCGVLEHVPDPAASLEEIRRVLAPGGIFYIFKLPNRWSYLEAVARHSGLYFHGAYEHDRVYDRGSATRLLASHGFTVTEFRRSNMLPLTLGGRIATRARESIWRANQLLSAVPGLNLLATNLELVARLPSS